jgi:putative membrane protein
MASPLLDLSVPGAAYRRVPRRMEVVLCTKENVMKKSTGLLVAATLVVVICGACRADRDDRIAQNTTGAAARPNGGPAAGQQSEAASPTGAAAETALSEADRDFAMEAASGGLMEVELGKIAAERAQAPEVQAFGRHMAGDHGRANERLKQVAARKGLSLPTQMTAEHKAQFDQLSALRGAEFDRKYMDAMVKDHEEDITNFEHQIRQGQDRDIKQFAQETLGTLRTHLAEAQKIDKDQDAAASAQGAEQGDGNQDVDR